MRVKVNVSLEEDTAKEIKKLASNEHKTVSQWVTDKVWEEHKEKEKKNYDRTD
ncbi:MAG: hypothetical protein K6E28_11615 [Eubacterium sp.]|nr:hypothetical protein [Eubacterium sp.]